MQKDSQDVTPKQSRFIEEYLIDRNGTQAAIRAGYSKKTANEQASRLLANVNIKAILAEKEQKLQEKVEITQEYILKNLKNIADFNQRIITKKTTKAKGGEDNTDLVVEESVEERMIDANAAIRSSELLGKHLGMFTEKVEVTGKDGKDLIPPDQRRRDLARKLAFLFNSINKS
jgi:phage terminase small subunit